MESPTVIPSSSPEPVSPPADTSSFDTSLSELQAHKVARGYMKEPPKAPETPANAEPVAPVAEPDPPKAAEPANALATPVDADDEPPEPEPKGPEPVAHRWKDPDTGVRLDLRKKEHRRIKELLEDRSRTAAENRELRARLSQPPQAPQPERPAARAAQPDPNDPEPTLEQFADQPDPYGAYVAATARWHARQEHQQLSAQREGVARMQRIEAQVNSAQEAFNAGLPEVRTRYPDFDTAYEALTAAIPKDPRLNAPLVSLLLKSDIKYDIAYYLGHHQEELQALYRVRTRLDHERALGALDARVRGLLKSGPAQTSTTRAPAPTSPVHTGAPATIRTAEDIAKSGDLQAWKSMRGMASVGR